MNNGLLGWPLGGSNKNTSVAVHGLPVIDNLAVWLRSNGIRNLNNGDPVATWIDESGQGNDATQTTGGNKPTYVTDVLRGWPVVRFSGSTQWFNFPNIASAWTEGTVFAVLKTFDSGNWGHWTWGTDSINDAYAHSSGIYDTFGSTARKGPITALNAVTNWNVYNVLSKAGEFTVRMNNTQAYTTTSIAVAFTASPKIGVSVGGQGWKGDMAEFLCYSRALTTGEITAVHDYLKAKWGTP